MSRLFDRYDGPAFMRLFAEAGVLAALEAKGFTDFEVEIAEAGLAMPHVWLLARKAGHRHLLLDACLRRLGLAPQTLYQADLTHAMPLELLLVQWVRAEDPTAAFGCQRPPLLLQSHPGLGVLRRAFRVAVRIASDLHLDGVASRPKFFHDAVIFHRSRLFLFLDGHEQGRFEALRRDLEAMPLHEATLAVAGWCVRDESGHVLQWTPGYQVFPLSARLTEHFHSPRYAADVDAARLAGRFQIEPGAFAKLRECARPG